MRRRPLFRMPVSAVVLILALPLIFTSACRRAEIPYRFVDRLEEANVVVSPMKTPSTKTGQKSPGTEDMNSYLVKGEVHDPLTGKNPFSLLRKLSLGDQAAWTILAAPPTELRFRVKIPERGFLQFGYALYAVKKSEGGRATSFEILVEGSGPKPGLFQASLSLTEMSKHRKGIFREIDLASYKNKTVTLVFRTLAPDSRQPDQGPASAAENGLPVWINPVLSQKRAADTGPESPPNIILISIDTVRADHLGLHRYPLPTSPSAERLAKDGALFLKNYAGAPYTLTSHATMLTGLNPTRHQALDLESGLPAGFPTLAEILRANGYGTAAFTGGGQLDYQYGFARGFDTYDDRAGTGARPDSANFLRQRVLPWLKANRDFRFFLFLHTYQPHNPYECPEFPERASFFKKEFRWRNAALQDILGRGFPGLFRPLPPLERENLAALYDIELRYSDQFLVGPLIEDLKRLNLYENTLIILTSDHGEEFFDHISWEHGHTLYNELIHVPLLIKFPGSRFSGRTVDRTVGGVDLVPTVLEAAGVKPPAGVKFDGESLIGLLEGKEEPPRIRMSFMPAGFVFGFPSRVAVIRGDDKLILNGDYPAEAFKYFSPPPPKQDLVEFFNLAEDPLEKVNLAGREGARVRELLPLARAFLEEAQAGAGRKKIVLDDKLQEQLRSLGYIR